MNKKRKPGNPAANKAAVLLGKKSARKRRERWGAEEFRRKMREWGKLGGRPRKSTDDKKETK